MRPWISTKHLTVPCMGLGGHGGENSLGENKWKVWFMWQWGMKAELRRWIVVRKNSSLKPYCSDFQFSSVAQSCLTLRPHESQHTRPPCPSPTPRVHPNPCPSGRWCHPTISSSVVPFSTCPHQALFQWVNSSHEGAKGLELRPQHQSLQWTPRTNLL